MSITSPSFVLFVFVALVIYYSMPRRMQNYWLLLVSYAFYVTWAWQFALVILLLTLATFGLARQLRADGQSKRKLLWAGIGLNLLALLFFRSVNFFLPEALSFLARLGMQTQAGGLQILLPVGLSYYIVENISYLVDVNRGQLAAATDIVDYALYLAYFPKLLAGPIERARSFLPKLAQQRTVDNAVLARSFALIVVGAVRKLLIADYVTFVILPDVFEQPTQYTAPELWACLLLYSLSLYNDFSGYSSIVRGLSGLFGIELSINFQQPYFARSFSEFWNRWHITLSRWLRDYIYFPISRALLRRNPSRHNVPNIVLPPVVTMLASGLWHGLGWHTLLWGALHGIYQVVERLPTLWRPAVPIQHAPRWRQVVATGVVLVLVVLAWVPFRMELPVALEYWKGMFDWTHLAIRSYRILLVIPLWLFIAVLDGMQAHAQNDTPFLRWPRLVQALLLAVSAFLILLITPAYTSEPFIYQGF